MSIRFRFISFFVLCGICCCLFVPKLAFLLVHENAPKKVDAIILLSGGSGLRAQKAAELYLQGYAPIVVITGSDAPYFHTSRLSLLREYVCSLGVDASSILLEGDSRSTLDHMSHLRSWVSRYKWKKVMIVTSAFHSARAYRVFRKGWKDLPVDIVLVPSEDGIDYQRWWRHYEMCETVLMELFRSVLYFFRV
ncbi:MAG: YdcF family protein [bacterium]